MDDKLPSPPRGGACSNKPTSIFFPDTRTRSITKTMREAFETCSGCIVRAECAEYGIRHEVHGIWGGLTEKERVRIRKARKIIVQIPGFADPSLHRINQ